MYEMMHCNQYAVSSYRTNTSFHYSHTRECYNSFFFLFTHDLICDDKEDLNNNAHLALCIKSITYKMTAMPSILSLSQYITYRLQTICQTPINTPIQLIKPLSNRLL